MIEIERLVEQAQSLTPLPATTVRLAQLVCSPDCYLEDVAELIGFDPALTMKLLRAANSAASASAVHYGTVKEAVSRLGTAQVLAFAVACSTRPFLQRGLPEYGLDEGALWRHSVAAAVAAEVVPELCRVDVPPESFTAALLHDVGKLVMARFLTPEIRGSIRQANERDHLSQREAETLLLSVHHGELGGIIARHWKLPVRVVQGITHHHTPDQGMDVICDVTYVANEIAKDIEAGVDGRPFEFSISPEVAVRLHISPKIMESLCPIAALRYAQVSRRYSAV
jgi:hypothetical protein